MLSFRFGSLIQQQPFVAALMSAIAGVLLIWAWFATSLSTLSQDRNVLLLMPFLIATYVACQRFPVHVAFRTKVIMGSAALYLIGVLLPVAVAATAVVVAKSIAELAVRKERGLTSPDIATSVARWVPVVLLASLVAHASFGSLPLHSIPFVLAAGVFLAGDVLTAPIVLGPIVNQPPWRLVMSTARVVVPVEGALYLVGILGAIVAQQELWALVLLALPIALVYLAFKRSAEMQQGTREILEGMADTVDLRDPFTGGHSRRVGDLVVGTLRQMHVIGPDADVIVSAARVHDIGKLGIPDAILKKTGPLSDEEMHVMQLHAEQGAELLSRYPDFSHGVEVIRHHHESWDGTGYPHRLSGTAIPFGARVVAVADSWDAMTSDRPYRRALSPEHAATILRDGRGVQWDPEIVDAFLRSIDHLLSLPAPRLRIVGQEPDTQINTTA